MDGGTAVASITGPEAHDLLDAAVATLGGELLDWSASQVDHRPNGATIVSYLADIRWPTGRRTTETLGARMGSRNGARTPPIDQRRVTMTNGDQHVHVWRFPADPGLPGLATLFEQAALTDLLRSVGVKDPESARIRTLSYRPHRRAVLLVTTPTAQVYVKAVRPASAREMHHRLVTARSAGLPTPRSLGWSDEGLLVLEPLPGESLRNAVRRDGAPACDPSDLQRLLDRLPDDLADLPRRPAWSESARHYASVVALAAPQLRDRADALADRIESGLADGGSCVPVHGDFYEAQLLCQSGRVTGLFDIDTLGPGNRADDLGCLLGHLSVLVAIAPTASSGVLDALTSWIRHFDRAVDPVQLRVRAAGVVLSLATGPYRTQEPDWLQATADRLAVSEDWLGAAATNRLPDPERALTARSESSH
jgi:hypothetical protein